MAKLHAKLDRLALTFAFACVTCGRPGATDDAETSLTESFEPDLPPATMCGVGIPNPGELCFELLSTQLPQSQLQIGDFNEDALVDLASMPDPLGQVIEIWLNDGDFGFGPSQAATVVEGDAWFATPLDAGASADFLTVQLIEGEGWVNAYLNEGALTFADPIHSDIAGGGEPWNSVSIFDSNADGRADLLVEPYSGSGTLHIIANAGDGSFVDSGLTAESHPDCAHTSSTAIPAFSGFSGGLVFAPGECEGVNVSDLTIVLVELGGDLLSTRVSTHGSSPSITAVGELDGDTDLELLLWDRNERTFALYQADFVGNFVLDRTMEVTGLCPTCPPELPAVNIAAGNLDGDAIDDLALTIGDQLHFGLRPLADGQVWSRFQGPPMSVSQLILVDLDEDGFDDVVAADSVEKLTYILANRYSIPISLGG